MRRLALATVLIVSLSFPTASMADDSLTHLSGTWVLAETEDTVRARIDDSIDGLMQQMEGVYAAFRWVARPQLRKWAKVCERYELEVHGEHFTWRCDDDGAQERTFGKGSAPIVGEDGNIYDVRVAAGDSAVKMVKEGVAGGERAVFQSHDTNLLVRKAMFSSNLPDEVAWTMRYRRVE